MADDDNDKSHDVMKVGPDLGNGFRPYVRHKADCSMETGLMRPHPDGKPLNGADGLVRLERQEGSGNVFNVRTLYERPRQDDDVAGERGPAMVSSDAYRSGWDRVFGNKTVGQA